MATVKMILTLDLVDEDKPYSVTTEDVADLLRGKFSPKDVMTIGIGNLSDEGMVQLDGSAIIMDNQGWQS